MRTEFLPARFSGTGQYSDVQFTRTAAFILLFHSELETFLEEVASGILDKIERVIRSGRDCRGGSAILGLYKPDSMGGMPAKFDEFDNRPFLRKTQLACVFELKRRINANNGVKSHNLLSMYVPLGIDETEIEEQLLIDLNTIGARRGDMAHKSVKTVVNLPNPQEEKLLADRIIQELKAFELLIKPCA